MTPFFPGFVPNLGICKEILTLPHPFPGPGSWLPWAWFFDDYDINHWPWLWWMMMMMVMVVNGGGNRDGGVDDSDNVWWWWRSQLSVDGSGVGGDLGDVSCLLSRFCLSSYSSLQTSPFCPCLCLGSTTKEWKPWFKTFPKLAESSVQWRTKRRSFYTE